MRPDFGCGVHNLVFAVPGPSTLGGWLRGDPRVNALWGAAHRSAPASKLARMREPSRACCWLRSKPPCAPTNSRFNLVHPFYVSWDDGYPEAPAATRDRSRDLVRDTGALAKAYSGYVPQPASLAGYRVCARPRLRQDGRGGG